MRILVHEFVSGGGLAGRDLPPSLAREGRAMVTALVADLVAIRRHQLVTTADPRVPLAVPPGVEVVVLPRGSGARLDELIASVDAVWPLAPETDRRLERLAARTEQHGKTLLGSSAATIRHASDKARLPRRLARHAVRHPITRVLRPTADWRSAAREVGYPVVVKPARGAGCEGVCLARDARELLDAVNIACRSTGRRPLLLQQYVPGVAASVSILANGRRGVALTVNAQSVRASRPFSYRGGCTPLEHPLAGQAVEAALRACRAFPGLRGYVGIDLVLTDAEAVVIEVNPRLTTAYLGVRSALDRNVAALAIAACAGVLPEPLRVRRRVGFTAAGRLTWRVLPSTAAPRP